MERAFRFVRADEVDCRVAMVKLPADNKKGGVSLLLYKDARVDQNILDETVGPMNWQRHHTRDNANCVVSIWDENKKQWVSKEDTGTESNTEAEKGLASDSFKRACFNWGIGRELYTAPFIWISSDDCNIYESKGKGACNDRFSVTKMDVEDGKITRLEIKNMNTKKVVFKMGKPKEDDAPPTDAQAEKQQKTEANRSKPKETIGDEQKKELIQLAFKAGVETKTICEQAGVKDLKEIDAKTFGQIKAALLKKIGEKDGAQSQA